MVQRKIILTAGSTCATGVCVVRYGGQHVVRALKGRSLALHNPAHAITLVTLALALALAFLLQHRTSHQINSKQNV